MKLGGALQTYFCFLRKSRPSTRLTYLKSSERFLQRLLRPYFVLMALIILSGFFFTFWASWSWALWRGASNFACKVDKSSHMFRVQQPFHQVITSFPSLIEKYFCCYGILLKAKNVSCSFFSSFRTSKMQNLQINGENPARAACYDQP